MPEWRNWQTHTTQNRAGNHVGSSPTLGTKGGFTRTREKHCYKRVLSNPKKIISYHFKKSIYIGLFFYLFYKNSIKGKKSLKMLKNWLL